MSKRILGAAVVGLHMGARHLEGFQRNEHTRVVAVCDPKEDLTASMKAKFDAPVACTDYRELVDRDDIDVVSVCSPDYYHAEQAVAFMEAGKDILCEKPMTLEMDETKAIVECVKRTGRKFMIGQVCRYAPGFALAKKMVERGDIGSLYFVESEYAHDYGKARGVDDWRVDSRRYPFVGGGCHAVDLLRWIAGDAQQAFAFSNHKCLADWPVDDCTVALYRFPDNVIGKVMVSIGCVRPYTMRSCFYGTEGTIVCDNTSPEIQVARRANQSGDVPQFARVPVDIAHHNVAAEVNELVEAIVNDTPVVTDVMQGARTVATCLAAVKSARTGQPVNPEDLL